MNSFDTKEAQAINQARMEHLFSLGLPLSKRSVLDVGCGPGYLAKWFKDQGCYVLGVDARLENVRRAKENGLSAQVYNIDQEAVPGQFDIVFSYGLLYHLENPLAALRHMMKAKPELLLIETIVCDSARPMLLYEPEDMFDPNQSVTGWGARPSLGFMWQALKKVMPHVYTPKNQPNHPNFKWITMTDFAWQRNGHNLRQVYVGSKSKLELDTLVEV